MVPPSILFHVLEIILLIKIVLISLISCSELPVSSSEVSITCQIEYKTSKMVDISLWFQFDRDVSVNMSNWKFGLEECEPNLQNQFCEV